MDWRANWAAAEVVIAALIVIVSWRVVHWLNIKQDRENKRREIRVNYLLETILAVESDIRGGGAQGQEAARTALLKAQILGSPEQINIALDITTEISGQSPGTPIHLAPLLNSLRDELRAELDLDKVEEPIHFLQ